MDASGFSPGTEFLIILGVIFGSAGIVTAGYTIHRVVDAPLFTEESFQHRSPSQENYLAEVRSRNVNALMSELRAGSWRR